MSNPNSTIDKIEDALVSTGNELRSRAQTAADSAHDSASRVIHNVSQTACDAGNAVRPAAERLAARGSEMAHDAWAATREAGNHMKQTTGDTMRRCENYVSEQPIRSVAIAFAVGAGIAALILATRSRSSAQYR